MIHFTEKEARQMHKAIWQLRANCTEVLNYLEVNLRTYRELNDVRKEEERQQKEES